MRILLIMFRRAYLLTTSLVSDFAKKLYVFLQNSMLIVYGLELRAESAISKTIR